MEKTQKNSETHISQNVSDKSLSIGYVWLQFWKTISQFQFELQRKQRSLLILIAHDMIPFLALLGGQNIIWIFSNLRVSTF